jgi:hypothetical protein
MSEALGGNYAGLLGVVREILQALNIGPERKAASKASRLVFWNDGMLKELRAVANGEIDASTIRHLREKFEESEDRVMRAISELMNIRNELGATPVGRQIDSVVNSAGYGKGEVRKAIGNLLGMRNKERAQAAATEICRQIDTLNAELARLNRMANG